MMSEHVYENQGLTQRGTWMSDKTHYYVGTNFVRLQIMVTFITGEHSSPLQYKFRRNS